MAAIEDLLPHAEKQKFVERSASMDGTAFEKLLKFLEIRKNEVIQVELLGTKQRREPEEPPKREEKSHP